MYYDKRICVIYGGVGSEREVSLRSGQAVYDVLTDNGYEDVCLFDLTDKNISSLPDINPDVCVLALHGRYGEDGVIQGYLEMMGIPYTGSGINASVAAFDKHLSKLCFKANNIPTPPHSENAPCVIKPAREGSSVGMSIVKEQKDFDNAVNKAQKYDHKIVTERFIEGKELTVAIFEDEVFPPIWVKPKSGVYDYNSKYTKNATEYLFELDMSDEETELIKNTAKLAYKSLECRGAARVDIIYDGKTAYVLEVNTVPGMTETSLLPKAAEKGGVPFNLLIERMIGAALNRWDKT